MCIGREIFRFFLKKTEESESGNGNQDLTWLEKCHQDVRWVNVQRWFGYSLAKANWVAWNEVLDTDHTDNTGHCSGSTFRILDSPSPHRKPSSLHRSVSRFDHWTGPDRCPRKCWSFPGGQSTRAVLVALESTLNPTDTLILVLDSFWCLVSELLA